MSLKEVPKEKVAKKTPQSSPAVSARGTPEDLDSSPKSESPQKPEEIPDEMDKVLNLCLKNEWGQADSVLRALSRNAPEVNYANEKGLTPLMVCAKESKIVILERLLDLGASLNEVDHEGKSVLHYAAANAKEDIVRALLNKKADPNIVGGDGSLPLFISSEAGTVAVVRELLTHDSEIQVAYHNPVSGDTALHIACRRKDDQLAKVLCEAGSSLTAQNEEGLAPLHISAAVGDVTMIRYFHSLKVNPNMLDKLERSALHVAAERGHTTVVELLVEKIKADPLARTKDGSTLIHVASESGFPDTAMALLKMGVPLMMPNKSGAICLHTAAQKGHVSVVRALLSKGAAVDAKTKDQYTALHIAVEACQPLVIQTLLGYGAQVELKGGKSKETPLHIASRIAGAEQCVEMLIKCGADVNSFKENGETALHIAARAGHHEVVQSLLREGGDPTCPSKTGETAIHIAVRYCHWEVAEEMLKFVTDNKSKFDATILINQQNLEGETCTHYAAELLKSQAHHEFEDTDIIKLVLDYGGDTNVQTKLTMETPVHYCARAGNSDILLEIVKSIEPSKIQVAVNKQSKNGWSPLLVASREGHLEIVKILLRNHARVDVFDEHGKAALHLAAENGHLEVADALLQSRAFANAKSKIGLTPLHLAAQNGYNDLVKVLIENHNATVDALSLAKKTPLHMSAEMGQIEVCSSLIKMSAEATAIDEHGQTPLHLAAESDHSDVIKLFLKHNPSLVNMANTAGMTYAHIAASKGSVSVIRELMRFNQTVICTAKNRTKESTTLHLASEGGHKDVVKVLLDAGANPLEENIDGMTPLHLAAKHGHLEILDVLKDHVDLAIQSSKSGFSALHVAAHYGQTNTVRDLLTKVTAAVKSTARSGESRVLKRFKTLANKALDMQMMSTTNQSHGLTPLHLAAQSGHEGLVRVLLNSPGVQADAMTELQGATPLHLAAQNGHTAVVSLLLSKSTSLIHIQDKRGRTGLHLASYNGQLDMVALLLGQGTEIDITDKNGFSAIHFASKAGHLNVVKLLCEAGGSTMIETNDKKTAICHAAAHTHTDVLSYLMRRKHHTEMLMDDKKFVFDLMVCGRANEQVAIEEFITLSPAPCDTAAKMSRNFTEVAAKEKERAKDLIIASQFCEVIATDLMAIAASAASPSVLLKSVDSRGTPFLDVLIECEQKEVVAHPTIQKYLSDVWMGGLKWKTISLVGLFLAFLVCPPVWIVFSLPLKHKYNKVPIVKFMSYLVSHFFFILLLILVVAVPVYSIPNSYNLLPNPIEWLLLAWLSGLLVAELTNPGDRSGLGWIRVIIIGISAIAVIIHACALATTGDDRYIMLYIRNQLLAFSLLMCFVQLLDFLTFHHLFGPWGIIISSLLMDFVKFLVILLTFMMGFTLHISAIYQPVFPEKPENATLGDGDGNAGAKFLNPIDIFELLFFSLFGLVEPENLPPVSTPAWSREIIKAVFGLYMLLILIVLINLLIAMMSDTYQRIQAQSDIEWKFGRAKLIRNMHKTSSTPSPINLITKLIIYIIVLIKTRGKACSAEGHDYVNAEEGLDSGTAETNVDQSAQSQGFLRLRSSQVEPAGVRSLDKAIKWSSVIRKYYANKANTQVDEEGDTVDERENGELTTDTEMSNGA